MILKNRCFLFLAEVNQQTKEIHRISSKGVSVYSFLLQLYISLEQVQMGCRSVTGTGHDKAAQALPVSSTHSGQF